MKKGLNTFTALVTNISGSTVSGITGSGEFTLEGKIGLDFYNSFESYSETTTPGVYEFEVDIINSGQGHIKITPTDTNLFITPDLYSVDVTDVDIDDVYNTISVNFIDITQTSNQTFTTSSLTTKSGDDSIFIINVGQSLVGYTDYKATLVLSNTIEASGANVIGDLEIVNVDTAGLVTVKIPYNLTDSIIPTGLTTLTTYSDLQARDSAGNRTTLNELTIRIKREFTKG